VPIFLNGWSFWRRRYGWVPTHVGVGDKISEVNSDDFEIEWAAPFDGTEPPSFQAVEGHA